MRRVPLLVPLLLAVGLLAAAPGGPSAVATAPVARLVLPEAVGPKPLRVFTSSNRPDLISGGDARVGVEVTRAFRRTTLRVTLNGRDVTDRFALRGQSRFEAYLTGLRLGRNVVRATGQGHAGQLVITNHPAGGPVFSGPQTAHYRCQPGARPAAGRPAALRPAGPAGRRRHDDDRPGRPGAVRRTPRGRVPGP